MSNLSQFSFNELEGQNIANYVRDHAATLNFPEKLMYMMMHIERTFSESGRDISTAPIDWVLNGSAIVIREENELIETWLHPFFGRKLKLSSFLRKCYRWGFRKLSLTYEASLQAGDYVFIGCDWFQRDRKDLLYRMESVTTVKLRARKAKQSAHERAIDEARTLSPASGWDGKSSLQATQSPGLLKGTVQRDQHLQSDDYRMSHVARYPQQSSLIGSDIWGKGGVNAILLQQMNAHLMQSGGFSTVDSHGAILPYLSGILTTLQQRQMQSDFRSQSDASKWQGLPQINIVETSTSGDIDQKTQSSAIPGDQLPEKIRNDAGVGVTTSTASVVEVPAISEGRAGINSGLETAILGIQRDSPRLNIPSEVSAVPENLTLKKPSVNMATNVGRDTSARGLSIHQLSSVSTGFHDSSRVGSEQEQLQQVNTAPVIPTSTESYLHAFQYLLPFAQSAQHLLAFQQQLQQQQNRSQTVSGITAVLAYPPSQQQQSVQLSEGATSEAPAMDDSTNDPNQNSKHCANEDQL